MDGQDALDGGQHMGRLRWGAGLQTRDGHNAPDPGEQTGIDRMHRMGANTQARQRRPLERLRGAPPVGRGSPDPRLAQRARPGRTNMDGQDALDGGQHTGQATASAGAPPMGRGSPDPRWAHRPQERHWPCQRSKASFLKQSSWGAALAACSSAPGLRAMAPGARRRTEPGLLDGANPPRYWRCAPVAGLETRAPTEAGRRLRHAAQPLAYALWRQVPVTEQNQAYSMVPILPGTGAARQTQEHQQGWTG